MKEEAALRTELTSDRFHFDCVYSEQIKLQRGRSSFSGKCYFYAKEVQQLKEQSHSLGNRTSHPKINENKNVSFMKMFTV